ncbi:hypothetical protein [Streptomyces sp. NPDC058451]|uniref:hypothetical protein n=1 Tax=Streptomyces sp. NPDC058451 TaxID=3346506 RepID=UPI003667C59B
MSMRLRLRLRLRLRMRMPLGLRLRLGNLRGVGRAGPARTGLAFEVPRRRSVGQQADRHALAGE